MVDCDDWNRFVTAWSGGTTLQFPPCTNPEPTVEATGCRYLTLTPPAGSASIAFEVTSDDWLCVVKFVDANGGLVNDPLFQTPAEWGIVDVSDALIVPDARYNVRAFDGEHLTRRATARTWIWGDADNDGDSDDDDVRLVVDAFHGEFSDLPYQRVDIASCVPNRAIDFDDVTAVINAAAGIPYAAVCPDPCNHAGEVWASPDEASP
ncbi:MAG: hypothetical protein IH895_06115 [Planctomycetes bacterium]|nr:hypothetical protein [Planctomycetota bacterium]